MACPHEHTLERVKLRMNPFGGGEVVRDEILAARRMGKRSSFTPAEMNHQLALDKAVSKGRPAPTDFRGAAHAALRPER